jgi:hypothetical protein
MRLDFNAFKMIKPSNVVDNYTAGADAKGNNKMSTIEAGRVYRKAFYSMLKEKPGLTALELAEGVGIEPKSASSIVQKMLKTKSIVFVGKKRNVSGNSARSFKAGNELVLN